MLFGKIDSYKSIKLWGNNKNNLLLYNNFNFRILLHFCCLYIIDIYWRMFERQMVVSLLCQLVTKILWECMVWTVLSRASARIRLSWILFNALVPQVFKGVMVVGTMPKHWSCFFLELHWITSDFFHLSCPGLDPGDINRIGPRFALRELVGCLEGGWK